ncbi:MAG: hypothetical protein QXW98_06505 [Candidatus Caldarchaeum sp.]
MRDETTNAHATEQGASFGENGGTSLNGNPPTPEGKQPAGQTREEQSQGSSTIEALLRGDNPDGKAEVTKADLEKYIQSVTDKAVSKALKTREENIRKQIESELRTQIRAEIDAEIAKIVSDTKAPLEDRLRAREMELAKLSAEAQSLSEELRGLSESVNAALEAFTAGLPADLKKEFEDESLTPAQRLKLAIKLNSLLEKMGTGFGGKASLRGSSLDDTDVDAILQRVTGAKNGQSLKDLPAYPKAWKKAGV